MLSAVVAALAVLVGATVQATTGFGLALIAGPALVAVLEPAEAVSALLVLATVTNALLLVVRTGGRPAVRWSDVRAVTVAAAPGLAAGVLLLSVASKAALQLAVGIGVLLAVSLQVRRRRADPADGPAHGASWTVLVVGLTAGVLTTTTGTNGPPLVLWLEHRRAAPGEMRDTLAAMFLALNLLGAATIALLGRGEQAVRPLPLALLLAVAVAGHVAGRRLFHRLDARQFRIAGLTLSALAGLASIAAGVM